MRQAMIGALGAVLLLAAVAQAGSAPSSRPSVADPEVISPGPSSTLHVFFDQTHVGVASRYQGCTTVGEVEATDNGAFQSKEVISSTVEACELLVTLQMTRTMKGWLRDQVRGGATAKDISLVRFNGSNVPVAALTLDDAQVTGLFIRALTASTKDQVLIGLELSVATSSRPDPAAFAEITQIPIVSKASGGVRATMDGVVQLVRSLSSLRMTRHHDGRFFSAWTVADITFQTARPNTDWDDWYRAIVLDGRADERTLRLDWMKPNGTAPALTLTLGGMGLFAADANLDNAIEETPSRVFRAYVETVDVQIP